MLNRIAKLVVGTLAIAGLTYFINAYELKIQERQAAACDMSDPGCGP